MSGIKFMGKSPSGIARAIKTDEVGNVSFKLKESTALKHSHTYTGESGPSSSYFYGENKTLPIAVGHKVLNVSDKDKIIIMYVNKTDKPRRLRVLLMYDSPNITGSVPEVGITNSIMATIEFDSVAVGETLLITPQSLDLISGYKELDYPIIGLSINATFTKSGGVNQNCTGNEEVIIISR